MRAGKQSIKFKNDVHIVSTESIVGPLEGKGYLKDYIDTVLENDLLDQKSYEKAECLMHTMAIQNALKKIDKLPDELDIMIGGDLLNQITSSSFSAKKIDSAFLGVYGACSSFGEAMIIGATMIDCKNADLVSCSTSSHFSTAERQYRYPLELGTSPTPTSQRTVTASGCSILSGIGDGPIITYATMGRVVDMGVKNANNMGAAMAPSAYDTLITHLQDTNRTTDYYDLIVTGDLGVFGKELLINLCKNEAKIKTDNFDDCGVLIFKNDRRLTMGGSGAGCSSAVFNSYIIKKLKNKEYNKVLVMPTGALLSKDSSMQGGTIPGITFAFAIENKGV